MIDFMQFSDGDFATLCGEMMAGLGMVKVDNFADVGDKQFFRLTLVRESSDGMFRTEEKWLCIFLRTRQPLSIEQVQLLVRAGIAADVGYLLAVVFGEVTEEAEAELRERLGQEKVHLVLLSGELAEALAVDYGSAEALRGQSTASGFSFARLRQEATRQVAEAPWRKRFQTTSIQPSRVLPLHAEEAAVAEADLPRALQGGSFLLLGDPGTGKTTTSLDRYPTALDRCDWWLTKRGVI